MFTFSSTGTNNNSGGALPTTYTYVHIIHTQSYPVACYGLSLKGFQCQQRGNVRQPIPIRICIVEDQASYIIDTNVCKSMYIHTNTILHMYTYLLASASLNSLQLFNASDGTRHFQNGFSTKRTHYICMCTYILHSECERVHQDRLQIKREITYL